jgi:hypothetical protein
MSWFRRISAVLALSFAGFLVVMPHEGNAQSFSKGAPAPSIANPANMQLPVTFEMNRGQAAPDVVAIARTAMGVAAFERNVMVLPVAGSRSFLHVSVGSERNGPVVPECASGGVVNYISGRDRSHWLEGLPLYRGLRYQSVSSGIDLVLKGTQGRLEYDFELAAKADAAAAHLRVEDAAGLNLQADGSVLITPAGGGSVRIEAPTAYQLRDGGRVPVEASFEIQDRTIGFRLGPYDHSLPLVIDPVVAYTMLIGVDSDISVNGLAVDSSGDVIFAGSTFASNLPVVNGAGPNSSGSEQMYVTKLDPTGANILYSTYIAATGFNTASALVLDSAGNAYVSGVTEDAAFPVTSSNLGSCSQFCNNGFVVKLNTSGQVVYSTLIGSGQQLPKGLAVDSAGEAYVAGLTADAGLTAVNAWDPTYGGGLCTSCSAGFFGKLNASGTNWVFSSYFPIVSNAAGGDEISALAVDSSGNFYIGGAGAPATLVRPLVIPTAILDPGYAFVAKFSANGQSLLFSTDLPAQSINGLQAGADGSVFIAGNATANFPYTMNSLGSPFPPLWAAPNSNYYMFAAAINPGETQLTYCAYLGNGFVDATALDTNGNFYVAGSVSSAAPFSKVNALETDTSSGGFLLSVTPAGQLASSTLFGGHFEEQVPTAMAVDSSSNIYLGSAPGPSGTLSGDPLDPVNVGTGQAYSSQNSLGEDTSFISFAASIVKISPANEPQISLSYLGPYLVLRDAGTADLHISSISYTGGLQQSWGNCGSTVPAGTSCFLVPGTTSGDPASGTLTINSDAQPAQQTFSPSLSPNTAPIPALIYVQDEALIFAPQASGNTSPALTLQLTNVGASSTTPTIRANGPNSAITVNSNCGMLAAGASCTAQLTYAPSSGTGTGGSLIISSSAGLITDEFPFVTAEGLNITDPLQFSASLLSFETVVVGQQSLPHPFTLTNATNSAISIPTPVISNPQFTISANACGATLEPGQTCAMAIVFAPSAAGSAVQATLTVAGNTTQLTLVGTPLAAPAISASLTSLTFGPVAAGGMQSLPVTVSNTGSTAIPVNAITISNPAFSETDNCVGTLAGQQNCSISVSFVPGGQVGTFSATLSISVNGGSYTLPLALSGTSTTDVVASPPSLNFGSATIAGTTSAPLPLTLANASSSAQSINPVFSGPFAASSNGCTASLAVAANCNVGIAFSPTQAGAQQGALTLAFSDGTPSLVVQLAGTAVAPPPFVSFSAQSGSSTSSTVTRGQTASYKLVATASAAFSGTVALTCSDAAANSVCSVSPTSVMLTAGGQADFTVTVATGEPVAGVQRSSSLILSGFGLLGTAGALMLLFRRRRLLHSLAMVSLLAFSMAAICGMVSCGGGSGSGGGSSNNTPPGAYTLTLTATSGGQTVNQSLTLTVQ